MTASVIEERKVLSSCLSHDTKVLINRPFFSSEGEG